MDITITPISSFNGTYSVPGDKSISHRAVMIGSLAKGITTIRGFLNGDDCISTINCFRNLGVEIEENGETVLVHGAGLNGFKEPSVTLDVGNSGTTLRLLSGILAGQNFQTHITGDDSIKRRPMKRIIEPLTMMGADIIGTQTPKGLSAPLKIKGGSLNAISYRLPVASAQLKSAILFSSLYAKGVTEIIEPVQSRNHTELMLNYFGADISTNATDSNIICSRPIDELYAKDIHIPGDISSAAFLIVAALILPHSQITITNVGINPTRTGILTVLEKMGADITVLYPRTLSAEPVADITVKSSKLKGTVISGKIIPALIDEIPILAVAAAFAEGETIIADAQELKVKESNRISAIVNELSKMNVNINETNDGMIINGGNEIKAAEVQSYDDHRIAMSLAVAGLVANDKTIIKNGDCTSISFPNFYDYFELN